MNDSERNLKGIQEISTQFEVKKQISLSAVVKDNSSIKAKVRNSIDKVKVQMIRCTKAIDKWVIINRLSLKYQIWKNFIIFCNISSSYYYLN
jgi:hypothetical protein